MRIAFRWLLAAIFFAAGILHILKPGVFVKIVPDWVPSPRATVILTGICELFGAVGLLIPQVRWWAGVMLALYTICVFPANIKHAIHDLSLGGPGTLGWAYHGPRLLFQPVLHLLGLFLS